MCFSSGIKKKIVAASNRRGQKELLGWFRAITNHFYWSCDTSKGDQEVSVERGVVNVIGCNLGGRGWKSDRLLSHSLNEMGH